jgi:hypothetical protein
LYCVVDADDADDADDNGRNEMDWKEIDLVNEFECNCVQ